jgi:hypothetical protein
MKKDCIKLLNSMEEQRIYLFRELDHYNSDQLSYSPGEGEWNTLQVLDHLYEAERLSTIYIKRSLSKRDLPEVAGFGSAVRLFLLKSAFSLPISYKAPSIVDPEGKELSYSELKMNWAAVRSELMSLIEDHEEDVLKREIYRHQVAGLMNMKQALEFMEKHTAHHRKQILRIRDDLSFPKGD